MVKCLLCKEQFKTGTQISFHRFPKEENKRKQWLDACKISHKTLFLNSVICSKHFKKENFDYDKEEFTTRIRRLKKDVVPSIFNEKRKLTQKTNQTIPRPGSSTSDASSSTVDTNNPSNTILISSNTSNEIANILNTTQKTSYTGLRENVRYVSELQEEHFASPRKRKRNVLFMMTKYEEMRIENRKLKQKCRRLTERLSSLQDVLNRITNENLLNTNSSEDLMAMIPSSLKDIIERQIKTSSGIRKYDPNIRRFALTLHYYSPRAYNFVRQEFKNLLPHPESIRKWYNVIGGNPGFTKEAFDALQARCKDGKNVVVNVAIDEMSIRQLIEWDGKKYHGFVDLGTDLLSDGEHLPTAKHALVFLAVSLNEHFKVPLAYFLVSSLNGSERASLLEKCLYLLYETGAKTYSITFDGAPVNLNMCTELGASFDYNNLRPWFPHPVTKEPVYTFWDACHMIKLCRNTFGEKRILIDPNGEEINWRYIENLVDLQKEEGLHVANKLKHRHIDYKNEKMKVKLAVQTLSASVSEAITFCEKRVNHELFRDSSATAKFCLTLNDAFDMLNGRSVVAKYRYKRPVNDATIHFVKTESLRIREYLSNLKDHTGKLLINSNRKTGFLGMIICLENLVNLYSRLRSEQRYLLPYKLSQDHLEIFFSAIRSRGGYNNNPSVRQFTSAYKRLLVRHQISGSLNGNCALLEQTMILYATSSSRNTTDAVCEFDVPDDEDEEYLFNFNALDIFQEDVVEYTAGFVIRKIMKKHVCEICALQLIKKSESVSSYNLIMIKRRGRLYEPSSDVFKICKVAEIVIREFQDTIFMAKGIRFLIIKCMTKLRDVFVNNDMLLHILDQDILHNHRDNLIKLILEYYINVRMHYEGKKKSEKDTNIRSKYARLILFKHQ